MIFITYSYFSYAAGTTSASGTWCDTTTSGTTSDGCYFTQPLYIESDRVSIISISENERIKNAKEEREKRDKAEERAKKLLFEHLNEEDIQKYLNEREISIKSKIFNDIMYGLPFSGHSKIKVYRKNEVDKLGLIGELCLRINADLPNSDKILGKFLHIVYNEREFIEKSNWFGVGGEEPLQVLLNR